MDSHQLVEPKEADNFPQEIRDLLESKGLAKADAERLARFLFSPGVFDQAGLEEDVSAANRLLCALETVVKIIVDENRGNRDLQLGSFLLSVAGLAPPYSTALKPMDQGSVLQEEGRVRWVIPHWIGRGFDELQIDSVKFLSRPDSKRKQLHPDFIYQVLLPRIDLAAYLNWDALPRTKRKGFSNMDFEDCRLLEYWLIHELDQKLSALGNGIPIHELPESVVLQKIFSRFAACPKESLAGEIMGLVHAVEDAMICTKLNHFGDGFAVVAEDLKPLVELVEALNPWISCDKTLRHAWRYVACRTFGPEFGGADGLSDVQRNQLLQEARVDLGRLRVELRQNPDSCDWPFAQEALQTLRCFGKPWEALSLLLQAFRVLPKPGVTSDLRYWNEGGSGDRVDEPWSKIPTWIASTLYADNLRDKVVEDPKLLRLREEFAVYCLKRLKTKDGTREAPRQPVALKNEDLMEPGVWWRRCYVKAVRELRVNPRGKSHHVLHWSAQHDPDDMVRSFAKEAYQSMRHQEALTDEMSPRRPLMAAFWWLRQAHRLELNLPVDREGAQQTRTKELRRIKEKDLNG